MAIHVYQCNECGSEIEVVRKATDPEFDKLFCEKCNDVKDVKRIIPGCAFTCSWRKPPYQPKGSKLLRTKWINGQLYDVETWNASRLGIRAFEYRKLKREGKLPKWFKEEE